jgi:hypothetical protein
MPKTNIYNLKSHPSGTQQYRCEVGWARGEDVTIAVTRLADGADPLEEFLPPSATTGNTITVTANGVDTATQTTAAGVARFTGPDGASGELIPTWQGWHMPLDRSHINTLIRELRKARDVAYGHDE